MNAASPNERRFVFLVSSARAGGNTLALAKRAAAGLPGGTHQTWLDLTELPLPPFEDIRHSVGVYPEPTGNAKVLLEATLGATDLVMVAPVYWYSLPAPAKLYLDHWSGWLRVPGLDFRARMAGRTLWAVTVSSEDPGEFDGAVPLVGLLTRTADYMEMRWGGVLHGHGSRPGDVLKDATALEAAQTFFGGAA